jgi:CRISPR-associated protein Csx16
MTEKTYFVSRHAGAIAWAEGRGLHIDHWVRHLDPACIRSGDTVIGTLPIQIAAAVCARGGRYLHLSLDMPAHLRGQELSESDMVAAGATLETFHIQQAMGDF